MSDEQRLDLETTYEVIRKAALEKRFVSYSDIAEASGVPWNAAWRRMPQHLGQLVRLTHARGWPIPSAIVVHKNDVSTGRLEGAAREGLLAAAKDVGVTVGDAEQFVIDEQRKVFDWAPNAPDRLSLLSGKSEAAGPAGPVFVRYFGLVLDALRALGGEGRPKDVFEWIAESGEIPKSETEAVTKGGNASFQNKIGWARFYLAKAGLIDDSRRGIWSLTSEGRETKLDHADSLTIFKDIRNRGWEEDENMPAPLETDALTQIFSDPRRQFWFAGAAWDAGDQLERFLAKGIWESGYDTKFSDLVLKMKLGDRIAIKSSFVKKLNLLFETGGKPVSCMRIKAIGTIKENFGDGKSVKVDWEQLELPRDWYLYTYRTTLHQADPTEDFARRLILFTFANVPQDFHFWTRVPYFAQKFSGNTATPTHGEFLGGQEEVEPDVTIETAEAPTYGIENIFEDGCFLPKDVIDTALNRLKEKKNIILQGPPGTGKTWIAKRLAYALMGTKDRKITRARMRVVQFHPSLSYEDFVRGWRPTEGGKLDLIDGVFLKLVQAASAVPEPFVLIIEEINRGNPAQVFGEMLTLLEDTKRRPEEAMELAYSRDGERIHIRPNLHIIGTMNIADRSLALVDLALRRRFGFISLEPQYGLAWRAWCVEKGALDAETIAFIEQKLTALNIEIAADRSLGPQFRVGHSYVTPTEGMTIVNGSTWFRQVVETEIGPLLEEYWFDALDKAAEAKLKLLAGLS
jgi:5-methylcytosine-specific restriction enzyme B